MTNKTTKVPTPLKKSGDSFADMRLKDKIGNNLKQIYDDVLSEDVPDDFLALLMQADNTDHA